MRILYIIDSLSIGGAEMLLMDLVAAAQARGDTVLVAYYTPGPLAAALTERGVEIARLSEHKLRDPRVIFRAVRLMRRWKPDIVHTHLTKSDLVGQLAARIAKVPRRVMTIHCEDQWRNKAVLSRIYKAATKGVNACIAVSREVADFTISSGSVPAERTLIIDNGVDTDRFNPETATPIDLTAYGVPQGRKVVAVIGRLKPQKDHETFLTAAAQLLSKDPELHFLVVGVGELEEELREQAQLAQLTPDRLSFTGLIRDVPGLLAAVDIVVISSAWEGLPVILLEAMGMARPIVATRVGGIPGVVTDEESAILVPPKSPTALADGISRVARLPELGARIGSGARQIAVTGYSSAMMTQRTFNTYSNSPSPTQG